LDAITRRKSKHLAGHDAALRLPDATRSEKGELSKSGRTRQRILNAAIDCLANDGYAGTTTSTVAERASLTRPAMQYHFPSRASLIEAAIHHIMRERLQMYLVDRAKVDSGQIASVADMAWGHTQTNVFRAFTELLIASRTDSDLSSVFSPALAEYDRARRSAAMATFTPAQLDAPWFDLRRDVFRFLLEGLAMQGGLSFDVERRKSDILRFLRVLDTQEGKALFKRAHSDAKRRTPVKSPRLRKR
jgi:AcrR family transcriptional regulator